MYSMFYLIGAAFKSLPYRDTVLTWLLRDALNGCNHTTMLATISPSHLQYEETISTLKYAERLCLIGNHRSTYLGDLSLFSMNNNNNSSRIMNGNNSSNKNVSQSVDYETGSMMSDSVNGDEYSSIIQGM